MPRGSLSRISSVWCRLTGTSCNICSPFSDLCCMPRGSQPRYSHACNVHPILKSFLQSRRNSAIITLCILGFVFLQFDVGEWVGKIVQLTFAPSHLGGITISVWLTWRLQHLKFRPAIILSGDHLMTDKSS